MPTSSDNNVILSQIQKDLAIMMERERYIKEALSEMSVEIAELKDEVVEMRNMANRWKGGFIVLAGLGGIFGWVLSTWGSVSQILGK